MSEAESELTPLFAERPLVNFEEGPPASRTQLTLTPWEIREVVRRVMRWHLGRIEKLGRQMGRAET